MINAVGVSNMYGDHYDKTHGRALMNYQVALAWISDESEATYTWFFDTIREKVFVNKTRLSYTKQCVNILHSIKK
jgi:hypothetical protein